MEKQVPPFMNLVDICVIRDVVYREVLWTGERRLALNSLIKAAYYTVHTYLISVSHRNSKNSFNQFKPTYR